MNDSFNFFSLRHKGGALLLCLFLTLTIQPICAYNALHFKHPDAINTMGTNEVRKLYQDKRGYLWIATYSGLIRYDGYQYKTYKIDPLSQTQILNSSVNLSVEDRYGVLWIGTHNGLYYKDPLTAQIHEVTTPILDRCRIEAICPSADGTLWVTTNRGLFTKADGADDFVYCIGDKWNLNPTDMKAIVEDAQGYLWIGTWSDGLIRYDTKKRVATTYPQIEALNSSHTLFLDTDQTLWVGTWGNGLVHVYPNNLQQPWEIRQYQHSPQPQSLLDNIIYAITRDANGCLWVGSRAGLSILTDPQQGIFENYAPQNTPHNLPANEINSILQTKDNMMWLGSLGGGLWQADPLPRKVSPSSVNALLQATYGATAVRALYKVQDVFYISLAGYGLVVCNSKNQQVQSYHQIPALQAYHALTSVQAIQLYHDALYFGTEDGIIIYQPQSGQVKHIRTHFRDAYVNGFYQDKSNQLWVMTRTDLGVLQGDEYVPLRQMRPNLPKESYLVNDIVEDNDHNLWFATADRGVYCFSLLQKESPLKAYNQDNGKLRTEGASSLLLDSQNRLWIGTEMGLQYYATPQDQFCTCHHLPILEDNNLTITNLWERDSSLWIASNKGIIQIGILHHSQSTLYPVTDGCNPYFHRGAVCQESDGTVWIGGPNGIDVMTPKESVAYPLIPALAITHIAIGNKDLGSFSDKGVQYRPAPLQEPDTLSVDYKNNHINIELSLLDFRNSRQNHYAYQLIGWDKEPVYVDAEHRQCTYNNLPAGHYTLMVAAANANNKWTEFKPLLQIQVKPAPWVSWWAYVLYVFGALGILSVIFCTLLSKYRQQQALKKSEAEKKQIEEITHLKLQFFTNITHEILTPLSVISSAVEELKSKREAPEYDLITRQCNILMRLIQQILEFRKAESGNLRLLVAYGNITQFVQQALTDFRPVARKRNLTWTFSTTLSTDLMGYFDADKLDKILYNLLSNAVKYNQENGSVTVLLNSDEKKEHLYLKVIDTGIGMNKQEMQHLFERFYDGSYRLTHTIGTGIGLNLVRSLCELHHGQIFAESEKGKGTTFTVVLPIGADAYNAQEKGYYSPSRDTIEEAPTTPSAIAPTEPLEVTPDSPTLLIVEDEQDMGYLLCHRLKKRYQVLWAKTAEEAWETLATQDIQLILSDVMLPQKDGYTLCKDIKASFEYSHIPVILLTAKVASSDKVLGYESGADMYLTKPIELSVLESAIASQLQKANTEHIDKRKKMVFEANTVPYTPADKQFIEQAINCIQKHMGDTEFDLNVFVDEMNVSRTTLTERMKACTGLSPIAFANDLRLSAAAHILEENGKTRVSDLAYTVGFNDPKYFSTLFKRKYKLSPLDYARQHHATTPKA